MTPSQSGVGRKPFSRLRKELHWQILLALALAIPSGLLLGYLQGGTDEAAHNALHATLYSGLELVGTLFLNALKMLIVPLIVSSIISGIAGIGSSADLGRLGGRTALYYLGTSLVAILIGLLLVNLFTPGIIAGEPASGRLGLQADTRDILDNLQAVEAGGVANAFLRLIPVNIFSAAAADQMLGLITFSLLYGFFMTRINATYAEVQYNFWHGVYEVMMRITSWVIRFAPLGVFALVARVVADTGFAAFLPLGWFFFTVLLALGVHFFLILPLLLYFVGKVNPWRHYRAMAPALLTAFSTASSSATLPLTMESVEKNAGVSSRVSSFVLPLGATVNMDGTALYECVAAMFIAQAYGVELGIGVQFTIVMLALLTSIGVAGIPAASLVAIAVILANVGLPLEGVGLILAVDRVLDMCRTAVNVFSDSCGAVIIARLEGEENILQVPAPLS